LRDIPRFIIRVFIGIYDGSAVFVNLGNKLPGSIVRTDFHTSVRTRNLGQPAVAMADLRCEHYAKKEMICDLFAEEQKALVALPNEKFRIFTLEKVKTDKYSFVRFDGNDYTTSPEYPKCEMWLEIGNRSLRILNENYEEAAVHERRYGRVTEPIGDFKNYVGMLVKRPRVFLNSPYFSTLPEGVQKHLKSCGYADLKKMLLTLFPIVQEGKIGDAQAVLDLLEIRNPDEFATACRALTEATRPLPMVTAPNTPHQQPYLPELRLC
jgi:hypothetical protein